MGRRLSGRAGGWLMGSVGVLVFAGAGSAHAPPPAANVTRSPSPGDAAARGEPAWLASIRVPNLRQRLLALGCHEPDAYFLLAEEVIAESGTATAAHNLARQLLVLAYELTRLDAEESGDVARLRSVGRSVCLALAELASKDEERRWLIALADLQDAEAGTPALEPPAPGSGRDAAALDLAAAMGYARSGDGRRAEQLLDQKEVADLLARYDAILSPIGERGTGMAQLRRAAQQWPVCPECSNRRVVARAGGPDVGRVHSICGTCQGNPGPRMSDAELIRQLRLESMLLSGVQRSWSAQVAMDGGAPLREPDLGELAAFYGVDPLRCRWDGGRWVAPVEGVAAECGQATDVGERAGQAPADRGAPTLEQQGVNP